MASLDSSTKISHNPTIFCPKNFNKLRNYAGIEKWKRFPQQDSSSGMSRSNYPSRSVMQQGDPYMRNSQMNGLQHPPSYPGQMGPAGPFSYMPNQNRNNYRSSNIPSQVKPARLPFFDSMATLLQPQLLAPCHHGDKLHDCYFSFNMDPQYDRHISLTYDKMKTELPRVEMQLRFFLADASCEQKDDFPIDCTVRVNDLQVDLPPIIPTNKQGVEPKRLSRPVDITPYYCARRHKAVRINVTWRRSQDKEKLWICAVYLVRRVTSDILLQRLNQIGPSMPEETKTLIRRKLSMDTDSDICTENLRVSLLCPLVKVRISIPGKVRNCSHVQCFDLDSFLRMNEKRPTWVCPVCNKPAPYDQLIIEGYFKEVLDWVKKNEGQKKIVEIEVFRAGNWTPITEEQKDREEAAKTAARDKACAVMPSPARAMESSVSVGKAAESAGNTGKKQADVIDLCDSSDDEEEKRQAPESVGRASSVSSSIGAPYTPVNYQANSKGFSSSSSSSSSESRASPSIIVLDSPPSNPAGPSVTPEDPTGRQRSPVSSQPPKKRFHYPVSVSETEDFPQRAGTSSVICAPGGSAPLPNLSGQLQSYPSAPRIMGSSVTTTPSLTATGYHHSVNEGSATNAQFSGVNPASTLHPAASFYGAMPHFNAPYYHGIQGNFFPQGLLAPFGTTNGNNGINFQNDDAFVGALEQNANANYMQFLNECMNETGRLLHNNARSQ